MKALVFATVILGLSHALPQNRLPSDPPPFLPEKDLYPLPISSTTNSTQSTSIPTPTPSAASSNITSSSSPPAPPSSSSTTQSDPDTITSPAVEDPRGGPPPANQDSQPRPQETAQEDHGVTEQYDEDTFVNPFLRVVDSSAFIGSMAKFAETLYAKLETEDNAVFSPFSLHMALTMLSSAASKESPTQTELLSLLGELQNIEHLESKYGKLITEYNGLNDTFLFGNKVWLSSDFKIKPSYNDTIGMLLNGSVEVLPANLNEAVARINNWASDVTKGKIPKLFDSLSQDTRAVLTNAIYFKDAWTIPFDEYEGEPTFTLIDGKTIGASDGLKMMSRTSYEFGRTKFTLEGLKNVEFQAVTIPYKAMFGDRFEMVIVMPTGPQNAIQFLDQAIKTNVDRFGDSNGGNWFLDKLFKELGKSGVHSEEINLVMPEFQVASKFSVAGALKQLGVQGIFNDGEFDSISDEPLKVSDIIHRAIIEVDKEGTVGAAATGIELVPLSGAFLEPELLIINQPFVFLIRDIKENVILFYGKVINPIS